jgi:trans-aconitate methyltransferase
VGGVAGTPDDEAWAAYYQWGQGRDVRELLSRALRAYGQVETGATAVDLGCGAGVETRALLEAGFDVTAVDAARASIEGFASLPVVGSRLTPVLARMQDLDLPSAHLVYAGYSMPFCPPEEFDGLWAGVRGAVRPGGMLAVDLFGVRDEWAGDEGMTFVDRERVDILVAGWDVLWLDEVDAQGKAFAGPKHWHRFEVVVRRPVVA